MWSRGLQISSSERSDCKSARTKVERPTLYVIPMGIYRGETNLPQIYSKIQHFMSFPGESVKCWILFLCKDLREICS